MFILFERNVRTLTKIESETAEKYEETKWDMSCRIGSDENRIQE